MKTPLRKKEIYGVDSNPKNKNPNMLGQRIEALRLSRPDTKTRKTFAKLIKISSEFLRLIENGEKLPSARVLRRIANATDSDLIILLLMREGALAPEEIRDFILTAIAERLCHLPATIA